MSLEVKPNFIKMEEDILDFWDKNECFEKMREKNKNKKRFRFLDGPITANNPMGIHHAWGRSVKDTFLRYKSMTGHSCAYRNGFDTQGLWVEVEVEKELGFKNKKDVENYGMDKFTKKCVERIKRFSGVITEQSKRLGQWMDWSNSYFTHTDENISAIWHFLKVCHERNWIAQSNRPMPWCPRCGTSLSEHEMSGSHKEITHKSVFCIAKLKDAEFDVLVWTTTPWTLSANVALAVNKDLDYAIVKCEGFEKPIALAKNAIKYIDGEKQVLKILKGSDLLGYEYETFFPWLDVQKNLTHKIVPWEDVDADEGCGVVHIAPGCGAEDFELGKTLSLPQICPINELGFFEDNYDFLSGKSASEVVEIVFSKLKEQGKLFKVMEYSHSYPVCWRCKTEIVFRLVKDWHIKTAEIRPELIKAAKGVKWEPEFIGKRMLDWLINMGDWSISRKRFYGLPLPFYPCKSCGHLEVIGSKEELLKLAVNPDADLPELHRPWIDNIKIKCPKCGEEVSRVPDTGDVWLDAGIVPFSTLGYFSDREEWEKNFPAEWVTEMQEQVRLWFYSLLFMSVTLTGKAPYEKVQAYGKVVSQDGTKFSKTGYMIKFDDAANKIGADAIRYLFAGSPTTNDVRFGFGLGEEARRKLLGFWNIYYFFMTYANIDKPTIKAPSSDNLIDKWLISRVDNFVSKSTLAYESYSTSEIIREFEQCVDDVSNWYVRVNRRRFWKNSLDDDKQNAYNSLYYAIKTISQVMAPIVPFMTEQIWQKVVRKYEPSECISVHISDFPTVRDYDLLILKETQKVRIAIACALKLRNEQNLKVKQPLSSLYLSKVLQSEFKKYEDIILDELNIKKIEYLKDFDELSQERLAINFQSAGRILKSEVNKVKQLCENLNPEENANFVEKVKQGKAITFANFDTEIPAECFKVILNDKPHIARTSENDIKVAINTEITESLKLEGIYREILRHCQVLRKEAGFDVSDRVKLSFESNSEVISDLIANKSKEIESETLSEITDIKDSVMSKTIKLENGDLIISIK